MIIGDFVTLEGFQQEMLDRLKEKHPDKNINLICGDYFTVDFGTGKFDCAVSFQTMHHFAPEKKRELYKKITNALALGGLYIECDYMVKTQAEQDFYFDECARMRREQNLQRRKLSSRRKSWKSCTHPFPGTCVPR